MLGHPGTGMTGKAAHMHLIDDGPGGWAFQRRITFPIVRRWVHHDALHCGRGIVAFLTGGNTTIPFRYHDTATIWIEQQFVVIKARSLPRLVRAVSTIPVDLPRLNTRYEDVPIMVGAVGRRIEDDYTCRLCIVRLVKEQQINA